MRRQVRSKASAVLAGAAILVCSSSSAWLLPHQAPQDVRSDHAGSRRAALLAAVAATVPSQAALAQGIRMPMQDIRYKEVECNPAKGEMLKGSGATRGLQPRCVEVTTTVFNPEDRNLEMAGVFGRINDPRAQTSVLANAMDGASDVGQLTLIDNIPPGKNDVKFRFVAALPKTDNGKSLPKLEFEKLSATWYPGAIAFKPLSECELRPDPDRCPDQELPRGKSGRFRR